MGEVKQLSVYTLRCWLNVNSFQYLTKMHDFLECLAVEAKKRQTVHMWQCWLPCFLAISMWPCHSYSIAEGSVGAAPAPSRWFANWGQVQLQSSFANFNQSPGASTSKAAKLSLSELLKKMRLPGRVGLDDCRSLSRLFGLIASQIHCANDWNWVNNHKHQCILFNKMWKNNKVFCAF